MPVNVDQSVFPMHGGAKTALVVVGVLLCLLIITIPVGIYIIIRVQGGRVELTRKALVARSIGTVRIPLDDVARVGICKVAVVGGGVGGALARKKVGGDEGVNLCVMDRRGKTRKFIASMYERHEELCAEVSSLTGKPLETVTLGAFSLKWPDVARGA
jgi:hypothetical protein